MNITTTSFCGDYWRLKYSWGSSVGGSSPSIWCTVLKLEYNQITLSSLNKKCCFPFLNTRNSLNVSNKNNVKSCFIFCQNLCFFKIISINFCIWASYRGSSLEILDIKMRVWHWARLNHKTFFNYKCLHSGFIGNMEKAISSSLVETYWKFVITDHSILKFLILMYNRSSF